MTLGGDADLVERVIKGDTYRQAEGLLLKGMTMQQPGVIQSEAPKCDLCTDKVPLVTCSRCGRHLCPSCTQKHRSGLAIEQTCR